MFYEAEHEFIGASVDVCTQIRTKISINCVLRRALLLISLVGCATCIY